MMDWRRFWIAWLGGLCVGFMIDRPFLTETIANSLAMAAIYLALGYLRERR